MKISRTIGMLGGGQLGRMAALSAHPLGISVIPYDPVENSPAFQVCERSFCDKWDDLDALKKFADQVDVITYEFENIPIDTIDFLESQNKKVFPSKNILNIAQHRIKEKEYLNSIGIPTTRFEKFESKEQFKEVLKEWTASEAIIKTCRFGYDGKGQGKYKNDDCFDFENEMIIEEIVKFDCEISVIVARDQYGSVNTYDPVLNDHKNHILSKTTAPAPIRQEISEQAIKYAKLLAEKVSLIGVLAVEFFVSQKGDVLANEIAPRPHNSGHWTIDACTYSQFEQQIRSVAGLPIGSCKRHSDAEMINLIGNDINDIEDYYSKANAKIHLYGKDSIKPGRKMGHVTFLK